LDRVEWNLSPTVTPQFPYPKACLNNENSMSKETRALSPSENLLTCKT